MSTALGEMGSLTMYWSSLPDIGMGNPPAESMAAVEPAAVQILRPLDRQLSKDELFWFSLLILGNQGDVSIKDLVHLSNQLKEFHTEMKIETLLLDKDVQSEHRSEDMLTIADHLILSISLTAQMVFGHLQEFHPRPADKI